MTTAAVGTVLKTAATVTAAAVAIVWRAAWYLPAWLAGAAWFALRAGWADGSGRPDGGADGINDLGG